MTTLPPPSFEAQQHSQQLIGVIQNAIHANGEWLSFERVMHHALYAPQLGYYSAGSQKFGKGGDFVTAPEMSPIFAHTLATQIAQILNITQGDILELGAGTGVLAADLLTALAKLDQLPEHYYILEVSNHLRKVQFENLQKKLNIELFKRLVWLSELPEKLEGVVLGNEVLDAIPVHLIHKNGQGVFERGVAIAGDSLIWQDKILATDGLKSECSLTSDALKVNVSEYQLLGMVEQQVMPDNYLTEFCPAAAGLIKSLAQRLHHGVILMLDYGFTAQEYYHPQRNLGTLMCHYQHYAHTNPLVNIGLQDITAHVDFTAIALAGVDNGLALGGFCSQAQFLMNCGILNQLTEISPEDVARYAPVASAVQKLLSPAEMGDLFKVMALCKGLDAPLIGFLQGDKSHTL